METQFGENGNNYGHLRRHCTLRHIRDWSSLCRSGCRRGASNWALRRVGVDCDSYFLGLANPPGPATYSLGVWSCVWFTVLAVVVYFLRANSAQSEETVPIRSVIVSERCSAPSLASS
jgi:hypothetical protein